MRKLILLLIVISTLTSAASAQSNLRDLDGKAHSVTEMAAQPGTDAVVLVVWCSQCGSCRGTERDLVKFAEANSGKVRVLAVDPHPADSPERIRTFLTGQGLKLDVMRDSDQALINSMKIDRTTTALVYDKTGKLRYFGPFQGSGKGYAADAVAEIQAGHEVSMKTRPLKGCPIPKP